MRSDCTVGAPFFGTWISPLLLLAQNDSAFFRSEPQPQNNFLSVSSDLQKQHKNNKEKLFIMSSEQNVNGTFNNNLWLVAKTLQSCSRCAHWPKKSTQNWPAQLRSGGRHMFLWNGSWKPGRILGHLHWHWTAKSDPIKTMVAEGTFGEKSIWPVWCLFQEERNHAPKVPYHRYQVDILKWNRWNLVRWISYYSLRLTLNNCETWEKTLKKKKKRKMNWPDVKKICLICVF